MDELKLTGNSLKGSRPILSFDQVIELNHNLAKSFSCKHNAVQIGNTVHFITCACIK